MGMSLEKWQNQGGKQLRRGEGDEGFITAIASWFFPYSYWAEFAAYTDVLILFFSPKVHSAFNYQSNLKTKS